MAPTRIVLLPAGTVMSNQRKMPIPSRVPSTGYAPSAQVKVSPRDLLALPLGSIPRPTSLNIDSLQMERASTPRRIDPLELLNPTPITKTRKRERLTALTPEEKLARRKMKVRPLSIVLPPSFIHPRVGHVKRMRTPFPRGLPFVFTYSRKELGRGLRYSLTTHR